MRCKRWLLSVARAFTAPALIPLGVLLVGCSEQPHHSTALQAAGRYAPLPGLCSSPHPGLQAELALLRQEQATPEQLALQARAGIAAAQRDSAPLLRLHNAFPALTRKMVAEQIDEVYPTGDSLWIRPKQRPAVREVLRKHSQARELFRLALPRDGCGLGLPPDQGMLVDLEFLEPLRLGCQLEVLDASDDLSEHRLEQSLGPLEIILQAARLLANEKHLTTRLAAARLRMEAFRIIEMVSKHKFVSSQVLGQIHGLVQMELSRWPSDADAWIGERAVGLHTYELVRDGNFISLLAPEEIARLEAQGILQSTIQAAWKNIDADELFYLQAMRKIVEASRLPYYQRADVVANLRKELAEREKSAAYPLIAGKILLVDFEEEQRQLAEDLARMQAWQYALSLALQRNSSEPAPINSLTGKPFMVENDPRHVHVAAIFPGRTDEIKLRIQGGTLLAEQAELGR